MFEKFSQTLIKWALRTIYWNKTETPFFNTNTISSMTTYTKSKCKVMFAQCSGNSFISHVLFASHYWTVKMFQQWAAYQYHKSWFFLISLMLLCSAFLSFFSAHVNSHASPRFHPRFICFLPPPTVIILDPTESRSRIHAHDRRTTPKTVAVAWYFSPRIALNAFLERICCFCSVFLM